MKRHIKLVAVAFAFATQLFFVADAQKKPNIIWLMAEDIGPDLECYGMKAVRTPNLNRLAEGGIRYTNCFASNPICSPNRSAMMVGVQQNKINAGNHRSNHDVVLREPYKPFTYWLKQAGYTTVLGNSKVMGRGRKTDLNFKNTPLGIWDGKQNFGLFDKYNEFTPEDQPFFAQIQLQVTHRGDWWDSIRSISAHPVDPDKVALPSYLADDPAIRMDWAKYLDQIEYMDHEVGILVEDLKRKGLYDNTVIIFIGDNGRCHIRGKGYLYAPGIHIPLIVHWPEGIKPRQVKTGLISAVDITATILDLAGIKTPDYMDGKSFMDKDFHRDYVYSARDRWDDVPERSRSLTTQKYKYIRNYMPEVPYDDHQAYLEFYRPALHVMRKLHLDNKLSDDQKKFFVRVKPEEELYDLEKDPEELNNLALRSDFFPVLNKMREQLSLEEGRDTASQVIHHATPSQAPVILDWVRYNHPHDYLQMLEGKEIGYQKFSRMYASQHKGREYFPPSDAQGGWRTLKDAGEIKKIAGMDREKLDDAFDFIRTTTKNGGLLVVRHGYLVYENYFGRGQRDATPNLGSCGKSFTSIAVGILMEERPDLFPQGLDQKIFTPEYMPPMAFPLSDPRMADIKLGQLLAFTAGIRGNNPVYVHGTPSTIDPPGPDGWAAVVDEYALGIEERLTSNGLFSTKTLWCEPGGGYSYATASIHDASIMLRHVTGREIDDYIRTHLAEPLGWGRWGFGYKHMERLKHIPGGGGIALRSTDMLRFCYMLLHEGRWGNKQVVPEKYIAHASKESPYNPHFPYSLQFNVNTGGQRPSLPRDAYWKSGSGGHCLYIVPSLDLVVWKLGGRDGQYRPEDTQLPVPDPLPSPLSAIDDGKEHDIQEDYITTLELVIDSID